MRKPHSLVRAKDREEYMFKRVMMIVLLGTSMVAMFGIAGNAAQLCIKVGSSFTCPSGTKVQWYNIGGSQTCYCITTGSEICDAVSTGVGNPQCDPTSGTCPAITCAAFGTVDLGDGLCDPTTLDSDCGIKGMAYCQNKPGKAANAQGNPFTLNAVLSATQDIVTCDRNGRCVNTIKLNPTGCTNCCINPNWQFITFTASEFN